MWCKKCGNGHKDYSWDHCGQCQSTDMTDKSPFNDKKYSMRAMWKRKDFKGDKKKKDPDAAVHEEIKSITKGNLGARNYEDFQ